jgi:hypothetical protein
MATTHSTPHTTPDQVSLNQRDLALILQAAVPGLREQIADAEIRLRRIERFQAQFGLFAQDLLPRQNEAQRVQQTLDELQLALAAALACQDALQIADEQADDVPALIRKRQGARPFGQRSCSHPTAYGDGPVKQCALCGVAVRESQKGGRA